MEVLWQSFYRGFTKIWSPSSSFSKSYWNNIRGDKQDWIDGRVKSLKYAYDKCNQKSVSLELWLIRLSGSDISATLHPINHKVIQGIGGGNVVVQNGQYNIGHICTKQQCENGLGDKVAFRWLPASGKLVNYTFTDLDIQSNKLANVISGLDLLT